MRCWYAPVRLRNSYSEDDEQQLAKERLQRPPRCENRCCFRGSRFAVTPHGWIDGATLSEWVRSVLLPHARRLEGQKVIIGDNLSSHFTDDVIDLCRESAISFVC